MGKLELTLKMLGELAKFILGKRRLTNNPVPVFKFLNCCVTEGKEQSVLS